MLTAAQYMAAGMPFAWDDLAADQWSELSTVVDWLKAQEGRFNG